MAKKEPLPKQETLPALAVARMKELTLLQRLQPEGGGQIVTGSFDPDDVANIQRVVEADLPSEYDRDMMEGQIFQVVDWYARWDSNIAGAEQEPTPGVRITLWDQQGKRFSFSGTIAVKCWGVVVNRLGPGPYDPPIPVTVQSFKLKSGRQTYGVIPLSMPNKYDERPAKPDQGPEVDSNSGMPPS